MKHFKRVSIAILIVLFVGVSASIIYLYRAQEVLIFKHRPLPMHHEHVSKHPFEEIDLETDDGANLNAILYRANESKGVVLYFPGQQRNRSTNGEQIADTFLPMGHDVLVMDYRGSGKSTGHLSYKKVLADATLFYDYVQKRYPEEQISVYGRSLGTGLATYVASNFHPKCLILEAPYFNLMDMAKLQHPYLPSAIIPMILKYRLRTDHWIQNVACPIHIFHGTHDRIIPHNSSHRLQKLIEHKDNSTLTIIEDTNHKTVSENETYFSTIAAILKN